MSFQIETERLIIRDIREDDCATIIKQHAEPEASEQILPYQADEAANKLYLERSIAWAKHPQREYYSLSVALKTDRTLIGTCTIFNVKPQSFETGIGWHFGHQYRGSGYATEAAHQLLYIGFELKKVNRIFADCFADNRASIRVMEKINMSRQWNFSTSDTAYTQSYGESRPIIRHIISRYGWLLQTNRILR